MKIIRDHSFARRSGRAPQLTVNSIVLRAEQPSVRNESSSYLDRLELSPVKVGPGGAIAVDDLATVSGLVGTVMVLTWCVSAGSHRMVPHLEIVHLGPRNVHPVSHVVQLPDA